MSRDNENDEPEYVTIQRLKQGNDRLVADNILCFNEIVRLKAEVARLKLVTYPTPLERKLVQYIRELKDRLEAAETSVAECERDHAGAG